MFIKIPNTCIIFSLNKKLKPYGIQVKALHRPSLYNRGPVAFKRLAMSVTVLISITEIAANMIIIPEGLFGNMYHHEITLQGSAAMVAKNNGGSIAIGDDMKNPAMTSGSNSLAIMAGAQAFGDGTIVVGHNAVAGQSTEAVKYALVLGTGSQVNSMGSIALGYQSVVNKIDENYAWLTEQKAPKSVLSLGAGGTDAYAMRRLIHLADGYNNSDAATVGQMKALMQFTQNSLGDGAKIEKNAGLSWQSHIRGRPQYNVTDAIQAAVAHMTTSNKNLSIETKLAKDGSTDYLLNMSDTPAFQQLTLANHQLDQTGLHLDQGPQILVSGIDAGQKKITQLMDGDIAIDSKEAINGGQLAHVHADLQQQIQRSQQALNTMQANWQKETLLKQDPQSGQLRLAQDLAGQYIDLSGTEGHRVLTGVADGDIAIDSKEAINGGQLAHVHADLQQQIQRSQQALNTMQTNWQKETLLKQDPQSGQLRLAQDLAGQYIDLSGTEGHRVLTGIADGDIAIDSKEAINGGQLAQVRADLQHQMHDKTQQIEGVQTHLDQISTQIKHEAQASVHYAQTTAGDINYQLINFAGPQGTQLANVANGHIAIDSKDAVNGGQLAQVRADLHHQIQHQQQAFNVMQANWQKETVVEQDQATGSLRLAAKLGGQGIDFSGTEGLRSVTGVAEGKIAANSNEVIIGHQLNQGYEFITQVLGGGARTENGRMSAPQYDVGDAKRPLSVANVGEAIHRLNHKNNHLNDKVENLEQQLNDQFYMTDSRIKQIEKQANAGIAAALAIEAPAYVAGKLSYAVSAANYRNAHAIGLAFRRTTDSGKWSAQVGVAISSANSSAVRIGLSGIID